MFLELARPVAVICCLLSLLAVFHTAFLGGEAEFAERLVNSLGVVLLAAGVAMLGGLAFQRRDGKRVSAGAVRLIETFPVRVFCWTTGIMAVLFVTAWYLETHCIFFKDVRRL